MEQKLRKYERPLLQNGCNRYFGPPIYKSVLTPDCLLTVKEMVQKSRDSVKDLLCHTTTENNRLEFENSVHHYAALYEILGHVSSFTKGLNPQDFRDVDELSMTNVWMNVQHANQAIGHHTHEEANYAFVIYVKNELTDPTIGHEYKDRSVNDPVGGMIEWRYGEVHQCSPNRMLHFPVAGEIVVFPGWLEHQVYPFTEDAERISVAGNVNVL